MVRRIVWVLLVLVLLCALAHAEEKAKLPQAVIDLCEAAHPGYEIAAYDGGGDEIRGQIVLILSRDGDNILCMAEKAEGDAAYRMTIDNTNAIYDGDVLPGLLIDSGGDALFYTYHDVNGHACEQYHTDKDTGSWSAMDVTVYLEEGDLYHSILSFIANGKLRYQHYDEDENGNILRSWEDVSIALDADDEKRMLPQHFNINTYDADPTDGLPEKLLGNYVRGNVRDGIVWVQNAEQAKAAYPDCVYVSSLQKNDYLALVMEQADGRQFIVCGVRDGGAYAMHRSAPLPAGIQAELEFAMENNTITLVMKNEKDTRLSGHSLAPYGHIWGLTMGDREVGSFWATVDRAPNGAWRFGSHAWSDISDIDWKNLPSQKSEIINGLNTQGWATPCSPNYKDRVHLRAAPRKDAISLGKYYNGTPVKVLERGEEWTHVSIFGVEGYMMTKFLAFGKDMESADNGLYRSYLSGESAELYAWPTLDAEHTVMTPPNGVMILAVVGDEWYYVWSTETGESGYMRVEEISMGNG